MDTRLLHYREYAPRHPNVGPLLPTFEGESAPNRSWGDLRARGRPKGIARARQLNRLRTATSGSEWVDFGDAGPGRVTRDGDRVGIAFANGMRASGRFVDPPGRPEIHLTDLRFWGPFTVRSAPTRIRIFTPPSGRLFAEYDRSLIVDTPIRQTRAIVERTGVFALDD